jgi:periplasmic divalent cation tolerance protein
MSDPAATAQVVVVFCTAPSVGSGGKLGAAALAETLVQERHCACVSMLPGVASVYRWEGKVERAEEVLLMIKTTGERVAALRERLLQLHPYTVPEFLVLEAMDGLPAYLRWVTESTMRDEGQP